MGSSDRGSIIDVMSIPTVSGNLIEVVSGNIFSNLLVLSNGGALYIAVPLGPKDCSYTLDSQNQTDRAFWGGEAKPIINSTILCSLHCSTKKKKKEEKKLNPGLV